MKKPTSCFDETIANIWKEVLIVFFCVFSVVVSILFTEMLNKQQSTIAENNKISAIVDFSPRSIVERYITVSNRDFCVQYDEYGNNPIPQVTNLVIVIRTAVITVFEIVGTNRIQVDGQMHGVSIKTGNFDTQSDTFYVNKAVCSTNH